MTEYVFDRKTEIANQLCDLAEYYNYKLSERALQLMHEDLHELMEGYEIKHLKNACKFYRKNPQNKFFPKPAEIMQIVQYHYLGERK